MEALQAVAVQNAPFPSPGGLWSCWIRKGEVSIGHQWLSTVPRRQAAGEGAATPEMRGSPRTGDGFRGWGSLLVEKEEAAAKQTGQQETVMVRKRKAECSSHGEPSTASRREVAGERDCLLLTSGGLQLPEKTPGGVDGEKTACC